MLLKAIWAATVILLGIPFPVLAQAGPSEIKYAGEWHLVTTPIRRVRVTVTTRRDCPEEPVVTWDAIAAAAPNLPQQKVLSSTLRMNGKPFPRAGTRERSPARVPVLVGTLTDRAHPEWQEASVTYEAILSSQILTPGPSPQPVPELSSAERRLYLLNTGEINYRSPAFQNWLERYDLRRKTGESELVFGNRLYRTLRTRVKYAYPVEHTGSVLLDCERMRGHCGNFSRLFIAAARANHIPARILFGHWVLDRTTAYPEGLPHTRSEFWVSGVGWVMADTSAGLSNQPYQEEPDVDLAFGVDSGNFLALHLSSDLVVPTPHFGPQPQWHLQFPYTPCVDGTWEKPRWTHRINVEQLPLKETTL